MHLDLNAHEGPEDFALPVEVRVKQGVALLDEKHGPGWVWRIDVDTLELRSGCNCVLGQLYSGDYYWGCFVLFPGGSYRDSAAAGFNLGDGEYHGGESAEDAAWAELTTAWRHAILARRLAAVPTNRRRRGPARRRH